MALCYNFLMGAYTSVDHRDACIKVAKKQTQIRSSLVRSDYLSSIEINLADQKSYFPFRSGYTQNDVIFGYELRLHLPVFHQAR